MAIERDWFHLALVFGQRAPGEVRMRGELVLALRAFLPSEEQLNAVREIGRPVEPCAIGVAEEGAPLAWRSIAYAVARALAASALRLADGGCDVAGVEDSSLFCFDTDVVGVVTARAFAFHLTQYGSGYDGDDAEAFARLMRGLLDAAGLASDHRARVLVQAR